MQVKAGGGRCVCVLVGVRVGVKGDMMNGVAEA